MINKEELVSNYYKVKATIPEEVVLVAVSKTKPSSAIQALYDEGQRIFGENRVEELIEKNEILPKDIEWHMIGHLQTKKVKKIASFIHLIHSVDSVKLLGEIDKQAKKCNRVINCLLQFHIAQEDTKYGFSLDEVLELINSGEFSSYKNVKIIGVMGMATNSKNERVVRKEFKILKGIYKEINKTLKVTITISMGMSNDYLTAIEEGSNMVRIGSTIFGSRN